MRLVVGEFLSTNGIGIGDTRTQHHRPCKSTEATGDVNGTGAGKIVNAELE